MPGLPKTRDGWAALLVVVALAGLAAWQASNGNWIATAIAALGAFGTGIGVAIPLGHGAPSKRPPGAAIGLVLAVVLAAGATGCKGPYHATWATMAAVVKARDLTAEQLAAAARVKHADCLKQHGAKTEGYAACIKPIRDALKRWRSYARPAINNGLRSTSTTVIILERSKSTDGLKLLDGLKQGVCAALDMAKRWGHLYPDQGKGVLGALKTVEGFACSN